MLLHSLVVSLTSGIALEALAGPISEPFAGARVRREVPTSHNLHERHLPHLSQKWLKRSKVPDDQVLPLRIGLKQCNLEAGHDRLMDM